MHRILHPPSIQIFLHSFIYRLIFCGTTNKPFQNIRLDLGYILSCAFTCDIDTVYGFKFLTFLNDYYQKNIIDTNYIQNGNNSMELLPLRRSNSRIILFNRIEYKLEYKDIKQDFECSFPFLFGQSRYIPHFNLIIMAQRPSSYKIRDRMSNQAHANKSLCH